MTRPRWQLLRVWLLLALLLTLGLGIWLLQPSDAITPSPANLLTSEEREWLAKHPILRLAPDPNFPPIEYFDDSGHYRGLIADYYPLLEARLGVRFEVVRAATWEQVLGMAQRREVDILGAAQQTPARGAYLTFSQSIIDIPNVIIVPRQTDGGVDFSKLSGKKLAITRGNALDEYVRAGFPAIQVVSVADDLAGLQAVSFGHADATVINLAIASYLIDRHGIANLRVAGDSGRSNALHIASRNDWPMLGQILAKGLASITEAEHRNIYRRWIHLNDRVVERSYLIALLGTGALLTLLVIVILLFNRSLRRQVDGRTEALQKELTERKQAEEALRQAENLQRALHRISEASRAATDLPALLRRIHQIIEKLMPARNFFVALYDPASQEISFPYFVDEHDPQPPPRKLGQGGLTETVLTSGEALLLDPESFLAKFPDPDAIPGTDFVDWLGVPLKTETGNIGVLAVQSYSGKVHYTEKDKALLQFVSEQVAMTIERQQVEKAQFESAEQLRLIYDTASVGILAGDRFGNVSHANRRATEMFGCPLEKLIGRPYVTLVHPAERELGQQRVREMLAGELHSINLERRYIRDDGSEFWGQLTVSPKRDLDGRVIGTVSVIVDVSDRREAAARLQLAANVFTFAQEGITITDAEGNIVDVNDTFTRITGYSREEAIGKNPRILQSGRQEPEFYAAMWNDLKSKGNWSGEIWNRRKNGEVYAEMLNISAVRDAQGNPLNYVALFSDITSVKEHQSQLERIAHFDALTGLPNRIVLADRLKQATAQARRRENLMALVYLDLDGFKAVNDSYGHETGDELLIILAQRLKEALREGDTLARMGGDEFVALLTDLAGTHECDAVLSRLLQAAASPVQIKEFTLRVSASLGVTLFPLDSGDPDTLLRHADQAMYQAKQAGKNRYHLFDREHDQQTRSHHQSHHRIAQALEHQEFVLYYQPKVNLRQGTVVGAEALIRWQHPERGMVAPGEFLPLIEGDELISRLGEWVLNTALGQMAAWRRDGFEIAVSVNIAAFHLQQQNFFSGLKEKLAVHRSVKAENLELELLETAALEDILHVSQVIKECQALGLHISLDDFGTGYSSLTYLKRLPANILKIDQSFVRDMLWDTEDLSIVEGIIALAKAFSRTVIAEGVETVAHGQMLLKLGCELGQGYGIARPMPAQELAEWSRRWRPDPSWAVCGDIALNRNELALVHAEVDHRYWVKWMENWLAGIADKPPPFDDHLCRFGIWYHGDGKHHFGDLPEFRAIEAIHAEVHLLGRELVARKLANQADEVRASLADLNALRDELVAKLLALSLVLSEARK